eukprot:4607728-Alexandrium_andersonii.AAC.1
MSFRVPRALVHVKDSASAIPDGLALVTSVDVGHTRLSMRTSSSLYFRVRRPSAQCPFKARSGEPQPR